MTTHPNITTCPKDTYISQEILAACGKGDHWTVEEPTFDGDTIQGWETPPEKGGKES